VLAAGVRMKTLVAAPWRRADLPPEPVLDQRFAWRPYAAVETYGDIIAAYLGTARCLGVSTYSAAALHGEKYIRHKGGRSRMRVDQICPPQHPDLATYDANVFGAHHVG
jgi:hypothetical protein